MTSTPMNQIMQPSGLQEGPPGAQTHPSKHVLPTRQITMDRAVRVTSLYLSSGKGSTPNILAGWKQAYFSNTFLPLRCLIRPPEKVEVPANAPCCPLFSFS